MIRTDEVVFQMDADYSENQTVDETTFAGRKRKGRSRFARVVAQKKPVFDPGLLIVKELLLTL